MSAANRWEIRAVSSPTLQWGARGRDGRRHACPHCGVVLLSGETPGFCCGPGGNRLNSVAPLPPLPHEFNSFINHPNISRMSRSINLVFSFASMESTHPFPEFGGIPAFVAVQGKLYHRVRPDHRASAMHWLLHDGFMLGKKPHGDSVEDVPLAWIQSIRDALLRVNPFVRAVRSVSLHNSQTQPELQLIVNDSGPSSEIAALISFENSAVSDISGRRLIVSRNNNTTYTVANISRLWEPLAYPLFFPHATLGWGVVGSPSDIDRRLDRGADTEGSETTQMWHYRGRLLREERFSIFGRLTCEYLVDMHTRDLENRLSYIRKNQERLRRDEDAALMGEEEVSPSENIYLPSSFLGSRAWAREQVNDSLAIAAALGNPTFFVTMTFNPEWTEVTSRLRPGQNFSDIPIVVARVFKQKVRVLMDALKTMFANAGTPIYSIQCIEFQKRGLPHVHILIKYNIPCDTPQDIDSVVSACLPEDPSDRALVQKFMTHRHPPLSEPASKYCQKEAPDGSRKCRFRYPQPIQLQTTIDEEGRVHYRRLTEADRMVVPYCMPLIRMLKCHINFEVAGTSHLFQYLFKYIHKGPDRTSYTLRDENASENDSINEIEDYWNARYLSAGEAAWRILGFRITHKEPAVTTLPIHLDDNRANLRYHRTSEDGSLSKLERYFLRPDASFQDEDSVIHFDTLTYAEYFTTFRLARYDVTKVHDPRYFLERPNGVNASQMHVIRRSQSIRHIARIRSLRPTQGDAFYLRLILSTRPARNFVDARTHNGVIYMTFQETAIAMGLFSEDSEAGLAIAEGIASLRTPRELRTLFVHLLIHDCIKSPLEIWTRFQEDLAYDFTLRNRGVVHLGVNDALMEIGLHLSEYGKSLGSFGIPPPERITGEVTHEIQRWAGRERELFDLAEAQASVFNEEQLALYETVFEAVRDKVPLCLFVDGKAGYGKTTVIKALCNKLRGLSRIVLPTATSAFAALLYPGGRTTHSAFKASAFCYFGLSSNPSFSIQVPVDEKSEMLKSTIVPGDPRSELIRETALIVWDEAPMANRAVLSCVNDILCDIMGTDTPFGGKVIILLGDFRQTCPVIPGGSQAQVVDASIKSSPLWQHFKRHPLIRPIRNAADPGFSAFVDAIGDGGGPEIPLNGLRIVQEKEDLATFVFPGDTVLHPEQCVSRSILAPTNRQVDDYNSLLMEKLDGDSKTFLAADMLKEAKEAGLDLPGSEGILDYARRHPLPGIPPHAVTITTGSVCRLLRNFSIDRVLVKNVRVEVKAVGTRLITVKVIGQDGAATDDVLIPRITFEKKLHSGHTLSRRQFPLAPAYATTFNSCQGLTLDRVGLDLITPAFSHGQLYTAVSRVRDRNDIAFRLPEGSTSTTNVTYPELL